MVIASYPDKYTPSPQYSQTFAGISIVFAGLLTAFSKKGQASPAADAPQISFIDFIERRGSTNVSGTPFIILNSAT